MGKLTKVASFDALEKALKAAAPDSMVFVFLESSYCAHCLKMRPQFLRVARQSEGTFLQVELESSEDKALEKFNAPSIPLFVGLLGGKEELYRAGRGQDLSLAVKQSYAKLKDKTGQAAAREKREAKSAADEDEVPVMAVQD